MNNRKFCEADKVAGVVILYNPTEGVIENINSYLTQIGFLFIVDNSEKLNSFVANFYSLNTNVKFIYNNANLGIAASLNIGAKEAIEKGYTYLLTMDQDSKATPDMINTMLEAQKHFQDIGLVSPFHVNKFETKKIPLATYSTELVVQASGNLLNLDVYKLVGPFLEEFFIDYVDTEYCLRLNQNNFKIIRANTAILFHNEANISEKVFLGKKIFPHNHSAFRLYFKTRNRFYLRKLYKRYFPKYFKFDFSLFINMFIKIILFEDNKFDKIKYAIRGYRDYLKKIKYSPFNK